MWRVRVQVQSSLTTGEATKTEPGKAVEGGGDNAKETVASLKKSFDLQGGQEECSQCFKTKD